MTTTDIARPRFARMYLRSAASAEERGATDHRRRLLEGLTRHASSRSAPATASTSRTTRREVTEVVAIEPEPTLRAASRGRRRERNVPIRVLAGVADALPLEDGERRRRRRQPRALLGSRPARGPRRDPPGAAARRRAALLRARGPALPTEAADDAGDRPQRTSGRRSPAAATPPVTPPRRSCSAGFDIEQIERFGFSANRFQPLVPHILGTARRM